MHDCQSSCLCKVGHLFISILDERLQCRSITVAVRKYQPRRSDQLLLLSPETKILGNWFGYLVDPLDPDVLVAGSIHVTCEHCVGEQWLHEFVPLRFDYDLKGS